MPAAPATIEKAKLKLASPSPYYPDVEVHFNPQTLVYSVENSSSQTASDPSKKQYTGKFSGKLTVDLQFDSTDTGDDVRLDTKKVAGFMKPGKSGQSTASQNTSTNTPNDTPSLAPPVISFNWGAFKFQGTMDSFRETIDFFSSAGTPLRALVSISLSQQDVVFDDPPDPKNSQPSSSVAPTAAGDSALSAATRGGAPGAARQLAADNGLETLRFTAGASLEVNASVQLNAAAGFTASGSVSASASAAASAQFAASGTGGGAIFGARASAGVAASAGAFAGLETGRATVTSTARLNPMGMLPATPAADVSAHTGASFELGGAANNIAGAGLSADVGATFSFRDRLTFDMDD